MVVSASSYALGFLAIILANSSIFINIGRLFIMVIFVGIIDNCRIFHAFAKFKKKSYFRFLNGLGLGLVIATVSVYIVEIATADMRVSSKSSLAAS